MQTRAQEVEQTKRFAFHERKTNTFRFRGRLSCHQISHSNRDLLYHLLLSNQFWGCVLRRIHCEAITRKLTSIPIPLIYASVYRKRKRLLSRLKHIYKSALVYAYSSRPARRNTSMRTLSHSVFFSSFVSFLRSPLACRFKSRFTASLLNLYSYAVVAAAARLTK